MSAHRWIDQPAEFAALVEELRGEELIGLDTEFHRERTFFPQVAVVQLGWGATDDPQIVLIDALAVDLRELAPVLEDPGTTIVMHAAGQDLEVMQRFCGTVPANLFDTQLVAGFAGFSNPSLATLVQSVCGVRLPKGDRLADWLVRPLQPGQLDYAASDVRYLFELYHWLSDSLTRAGRWDWALDECAEMLRRGSTSRPESEAWWRLKEARQLRGRSAGVAQSLAAWRERRAAEVDQPLRFVLPDLALVSMAQRPPTDARALRKVRGLDERHLRGGAAEGILAAIAEGEAMDADQIHTPPTSDVERELRPAVTLVSAWLSQLGKDLGIDATMLATRSDLEAFLRQDPEARLANGWRREVVGDAIGQLVSGRAALAFDGKGGLVLEPRAASS